ncbi:ABC transporter substrate-binding protein [Halococcus sediminicola]|uniref:ABC transporter substrate-binding protein n=1 Tax=Halococcus sediminicola TaxID=1264579 RepID=UPI001378B2AE|nr:ABC transporter substrate-binding protein [Halococcus sediminicola]
MSNPDDKIPRRGLLKATGTGMGISMLAGCTGDGGSGGSSGNDSDGGSSGNGQVSGPIKIGLLAPQPGSFPGGTAMANAGEMAVEQLNESGLAGADVEVVVKNTELTPNVARTAYQELILQEEVDVTTGVYTSESFLNIMDVIADNGVIHMSSAAITPDMNERVKNNYEQYKYLIRPGPPNSVNLGRNMVDFAKDMFSEMDWNRVGLLVEDIEGFVAQVQEVRQGLQNMDVNIVQDVSFSSDTEDFTSIFDRFENSNVDGAFVFMSTTGTPAIVQWQQQQRQFGFGGLHAPMTAPGYYESVDGACQYAWTYASACATSEITKKTLPFVNGYRDRYNGVPGYLGYTTYDAIRMWAQAVGNIGSLNQEDLISEIEGMSYTGTTGVIEIQGRNDEFPHDPVFEDDQVRPIKFQWQEDNSGASQETVWWSDAATAEYQKPDWI